jgi:hypothetical protein
MIEIDEPRTWRDLQTLVARLLTEVGVSAAVEKPIRTARGRVTVDVWAEDAGATPAQIYLVECKQWRARVPKTVVHSFRTVVGDSGANWGAIVSAGGFQKGAFAAAAYSNVRLLTWGEFQLLFARRWFYRYFMPALTTASGPLFEYTEPINSRISRKADALDRERRERFEQLREEYIGLMAVCVFFKADLMSVPDAGSQAPPALRGGFTLPLRSWLTGGLVSGPIAFPAEVLDALSLRGLLSVIADLSSKALSEFDSVFGERA